MTDDSVLDELPGDLMIWVLIVSELLVFGAGLAALRLMDLSEEARVLCILSEEAEA